MSDLLTRFEYDQTGTNPDNLVVNEPHSLSDKAVRAFAPKYGPFFTKNVVLTDAATNKILTRSQYQFVELLQDLSLRTGQEICSVVLILDTNVSTNVTFTGQYVGGLYQKQTSEAIANLYETISQDERGISWKNVLNKPLEFPPTDHLHNLYDVVGFEPVVSVLERIRNAIMVSDVPVYEAMVDYFNDLFATLQTTVEDEKQLVDQLLARLNSLEQALQAEIARATDSEANLIAALQAEIARATAEEQNISSGLQAEITRAKAAENAESARALTAENTLTVNLTTVSDALASEISRAKTTEDTKVDKSTLNAANGVATLGADGKLFNQVPTKTYGTATDDPASTSFVDKIRDVPQVLKYDGYWIQLSDRGRSIDTTSNVGIPQDSNVNFPNGSTITITNLNSNNITLTFETNVLLRLAGTQLSGNRTIAGFGVVTIRKVAANYWIASGAGLS